MNYTEGRDSFWEKKKIVWFVERKRRCFLGRCLVVGISLSEVETMKNEPFLSSVNTMAVAQQPFALT